ncbi:MAG TPA: hypothetical protein VKX49_06590 [Bryobacteraceae bacterium]|nr:hypothetical protein [Bryobacteraceae bacterium]
MYQLSSGDYSPQFTRPRPSVAPRIGVFIALWLLLALGYGGYRLFKSQTSVAPVQVQAMTTPTVSVATIVAWRSQAKEAGLAAQQAETDLRQGEAEVRKTLGLTDSLVEGKHLHAAMARLEAVRQGLERTRYDLDTLETLLKGEEKQ